MHNSKGPVHRTGPLLYVDQNENAYIRNRQPQPPPQQQLHSRLSRIMLQHQRIVMSIIRPASIRIKLKKIVIRAVLAHKSTFFIRIIALIKLLTVKPFVK